MNFQQTFKRISSIVFSIALVLGSTLAQADTYFFHNDHLGTPQVLTDKHQAVVWETTNEPFGGAAETIKVVEQNLRFPGQYLDRETGLHYNWNRYYDPAVGRYLTADPLGLYDGPNLYLYGHSTPLMLVDPYGLFTKNWFWELFYQDGDGWIPSQTEVDFAAGFGDVTSFGITGKIRHWQGVCEVDYDSASYALGSISTAIFGFQNAGRVGIQVTKSAAKSGKGKHNKQNSRGGPPRDGNGNYTPDPNAEGPHPTLGTRTGRSGSYTQGATFDKDGTFRGRTDVTDHRRGDHINPHWHPATGPNSVTKGSHPIPNFSNDPGFKL